MYCAGFISNLGKACSALAATVNSTFLQPLQQRPGRPTHSDTSTKATADDAQVNDDDAMTATHSISNTLLELWSILGPLCGSSTAATSGNLPAKVKVPFECLMHSWSDPQVLSTIEPAFSLLMAVMHLQSLCSCTAGSSLLSEAASKEAIWRAVHSASACLCSDAAAAFDVDEGGSSNPSTLSVVRQAVAKHVQELHLFMLAAVAGGLHTQQDGLTPAHQPDSTAHRASDIGASSGKDQRKQYVQQRAVADWSSHVLQHLGISKEDGQ